METKNTTNKLPDNFRIVKTETKSDSGEIKTSYRVQKKFLWWWRSILFNTCSRDRQGFSIDYDKFTFDSIEKALEYFDKYYINSFIEKYKGENIYRRICLTSHEGEYFCTKGKVDSSGELFFNHASTIEGTKREIDSKIKNTKTSVVKL
jgi:hypothetical protein